MRRLLLRRAPVAFMFVLALALLVAACGGGDNDVVAGDDDTDRQGDRRADSLVLTWESTDGVTIEAEFWRGGDEWVLMGHQFTGNRRDWDQMVDGFSAQGYSVLTWDFRCHGASGCNTVNNSKRDATVDIWREWVVALDYANDNGARVIHAGGASMGGTSLIQVAADRDDIASIFAISSPHRFQGLDALEDYDRVTVPKLFIVGVDDLAAPDFSQRYFDLATGPARLDILDTALHGNTLAQDPEWGPIVQPKLYAFAEDPEGFVAAGEVNNLTPAAGADADDAANPDSGSDSTTAVVPAGVPADAPADSSGDSAAPADTIEDAAAVPAPEGPIAGGASPSGYILALRTLGDDGSQVVVVDPFNPQDFQIVQNFTGQIVDLVWAPLTSSLLVAQPDQVVLLDLRSSPPIEVVIPTADFLPPGIAADFFDLDLSSDGTVLSFGVVPSDIAQAPSTPAVVNLLARTVQAPFAGELNGTPSQPGRLSPDDRQLLTRDVGALVVLDAGTLEVVERIPAPTIVEEGEICLGEECASLTYSTIFPDQYGWLESADPSIPWARYGNKLFVRLPGDAGLREFASLQGVPLDLAVSADGLTVAWVTAGPPSGTNALLLTDLDAFTIVVLAQDDDLIFFDVEWSPDGRFVAFTSVTRGSGASPAGIFVADIETGDVILVGPGCCARWRPTVGVSP